MPGSPAWSNRPYPDERTRLLRISIEPSPESRSSFLVQVQRNEVEWSGEVRGSALGPFIDDLLIDL